MSIILFDRSGTKNLYYVNNHQEIKNTVGLIRLYGGIDSAVATYFLPYADPLELWEQVFGENTAYAEIPFQYTVGWSTSLTSTTTTISDSNPFGIVLPPLS